MLPPLQITKISFSPKIIFKTNFRFGLGCRCACDQNDSQSNAFATTKSRDGRLDAIGSLWQTKFMLHESANSICVLSHFKLSARAYRSLLVNPLRHTI
jgi:hypothetical protein